MRFNLLEIYEKQHKKGDVMTTKEADFLEYLKTWHGQVILFVCGFLVHRIAATLSKLEKDGQIDSAEKEIWVSQFWNMNVNRVVGRLEKRRGS